MIEDLGIKAQFGRDLASMMEHIFAINVAYIETVNGASRAEGEINVVKTTRGCRDPVPG
jgi:hypothetical protein